MRERSMASRDNPPVFTLSLWHVTQYSFTSAPCVEALDEEEAEAGAADWRGGCAERDCDRRALGGSRTAAAAIAQRATRFVLVKFTVIPVCPIADARGSLVVFRVTLARA